jgi:outer membrane protein OmpA-like peptidoglycan-associated protein
MKKNHFNQLFKTGVLAAALFTASCAEQAISELEEANLEGAPFAEHLAREYAAFAKKNSRIYNHDLDARHFAVKGLQAAEGLNVLPEDPRKWDLPESVIPMITEARERLTFALDKSGRVVAPALAARTQVLYDCWVQETENGHDPKAALCHKGFTESLAALEAAVSKQAPTFSVMFDMNSSRLSHQALKVLEEVAKVAKNLPYHTVTITGYTDEMGGRKHNLILSQNRAAAVRDALIKLGVEQNRITAVGAGELSGKEIDPRHRRVDIQIR